MTIKEFIDDLLNKKWGWDDVFWILFWTVSCSIITTPLFGIPLGIIFYFWFSEKKEDAEDTSEKYNLHDKKDE